MYDNIFEIMIERDVSTSHIVEKLREHGFIVADGVNLDFPDELDGKYIYKYVAVPEGKTEEELYDLHKTIGFDIVCKITDAAIYAEKYAENDIRFCYVRNCNEKTYCIYAYKTITDIKPLTVPESIPVYYKYIKTTFVISNKNNALQMISSYPPRFKILCQGFKEAGFDIPNIFTLVEKNFDSETRKSDDKIICSVYLGE